MLCVSVFSERHFFVRDLVYIYRKGLQLQHSCVINILNIQTYSTILPFQLSMLRTSMTSEFLELEINTRRLLYIFNDGELCTFFKNILLKTIWYSSLHMWIGPMKVSWRVKPKQSAKFKYKMFLWKRQSSLHWKCTVASSCLSPKSLTSSIFWACSVGMAKWLIGKSDVNHL